MGIVFKPYTLIYYMSSERPGGPIMGLMRDSYIKFPPDWEGELPKPASREELRAQLADGFRERGLTPEGIEEALDFLETYEQRYYEVTGEGRNYHRTCGGGSMVEGETGIFCHKCGRLPPLAIPAVLR